MPNGNLLSQPPVDGMRVRAEWLDGSVYEGTIISDPLTPGSFSARWADVNIPFWKGNGTTGKFFTATNIEILSTPRPPEPPPGSKVSATAGTGEGPTGPYTWIGTAAGYWVAIDSPKTYQRLWGQLDRIVVLP